MKIFARMGRNDKMGRDREVTLGADKELIITIYIGGSEDSSKYLELSVWYGEDGKFHYGFDKTKVEKKEVET